MWDMFETYSELFDRWKLFFQIRFSKTFAWKWVKIRFLLYCDLIKARVYGDYNSITLQAVDTDELEGCEFLKKFRAKSIGDMKKLVGCRTLKWSKLLENPVTLPL